MDTLIPAISSTSFDSTGERRLAERLEQKLDADYLLWHNVPIGPKQTHPDFVVLHPKRGLVHESGPHQGKLAFPWGHGVVFTRITRKQFDDAGLGNAIEPHCVICQDKMLDSADPEAFQQRLWNMFAHSFGGAISLPQLDRVRWNLFPQVRVPDQGKLFDDNDPEAELPGIMRVMDLQQEQLARSLGDGHRVIHGVAGSGKTMILGYRAEYLARASTPTTKPVLILCFNEPLGVKLHSVMGAKGLADTVHVRHFHKWCRDQLVAYGQTLPANNLPVNAMMEDMVQRVIQDSHPVPGLRQHGPVRRRSGDFNPGADAGHAKAGEGSQWGWGLWQQAPIMTSKSRHLICRNTPCAPLKVA